MRLKEARKAARMTQAEVAKILGVNQNTYSYWETGKTKIDNVSLSKLAEIFNVSIDYLLDIKPPVKGVRIPIYMYRKPVPLKTKNSYRTIPIPQALLVMLRRYHKSQPLDIARRLFPYPAGTYHLIRKAIKKLDSNLSLHCLRHTYATNLLAQGMDIRTVAALMGDDTKTVINTYVHYTDDMRKAAADSIEKIFAQNF